MGPARISFGVVDRIICRSEEQTPNLLKFHYVKAIDVISSDTESQDG